MMDLKELIEINSNTNFAINYLRLYNMANIFNTTFNIKRNV